MTSQHYLVVDLECTCDEPINPLPKEIIEIGAVMVTRREIIDEFDIFVRPTAHPTLSEFCTRLTTITQEQVDSAPEFPEAFQKFVLWSSHTGKNAPVASWGRGDWRWMKNECRRHGASFPFTTHVNMPAISKRNGGTGSKHRLAKMLGVRFSGTQHRGIDDARYYAKILIGMLRRQWL